MTDTANLLKRVRKIEIKTRGLSNQIFAGEYHSAFKGRGMAFSEVREYTPGDPIRSIDWNVTARLNHPYVKVFDEEREITLMLMVDVSGSSLFGTLHQSKAELITEVAATLAFSASQNNDKVGLIMFSDTVEKFIPPKKGRSHILRIIRELVDFKPTSQRTNITEALRYFTNITKKRSIAFLISDMMDYGYEHALRIANRRHDMVCLVVNDPAEQALPNIGMAPAADLETGQRRWIDTSSTVVRRSYAARLHDFAAQRTALFRKSGIDFVNIQTGQNFTTPIMNLFKQRGARR